MSAAHGWVGRLTSRRRPRSFFLRLAGLFTPYVAVRSDEVVFILPTGDRPMAKFFAGGRRAEMRVLDTALARLEAAGVEVAKTTFVDVGAHIGTTTLWALRAGFSSVLACEPEPSSSRLLRANVALNRADGAVRVLELALSDRSGSAVLDGGTGGRTKARLLGVDGAEPRGATTVVRTARLDDLVAEGILDPAEVGFLWLDVEGHEQRVLSGAATILSRGVPVVIELDPRLLRRAGGDERWPATLLGTYTHVLDLRRPETGFLPLESLADLLERNARRHTDVLFCRLAVGTGGVVPSFGGAGASSSDAVLSYTP